MEAPMWYRAQELLGGTSVGCHGDRRPLIPNVDQLLRSQGDGEVSSFRSPLAGRSDTRPRLGSACRSRQ
ncbi:unnamed protein product [Lampetra planeri]